MKLPLVVIPICLALLCADVFANSFALPAGMSETDRKRFERFEKFQIKGVCGDADLDRLSKLGVNTVRGYAIPNVETMRKKLDHAHSLGMKMVVSEWMPHHGENKGKNGGVWNFDYNAKGDQMVKSLMERVEGIGDHPAILMWGLGNEVHLDEPYLRVLNRMSEEIHKRFPRHITSLTMINAKPEDIAKIKKFAPDIDVLGIQAYSRGAVRGGIKNAEEHWGKPFYMSEFNANGPWNMGKAPWGAELGEPVTKKVSDLKDCYAAIDASPLCLGSTVFVWGNYGAMGPAYFSLLLAPRPDEPKSSTAFDQLLFTPQADAMIEHFTGQPREGNHAPVLSKLEFDGGAKSKLAQPGEPMSLHLSAEDADGDKVAFVTWILDPKARNSKFIAGPTSQPSGEKAVVTAPKIPGEYVVLVYAIDNKGGGSAGNLPIKVPEASPVQ
jgi:hypothetical protein